MTIPNFAGLSGMSDASAQWQAVLGGQQGYWDPRGFWDYRPRPRPREMTAADLGLPDIDATLAAIRRGLDDFFSERST